MPHRFTTPPRRGRTPSKPGAVVGQVQSLTRGLNLLEALAKAEGGISLTDVSQRVGLPPSTTHRLLSTLEKMGYVYQGGDLGLWYVGLQAFTVGAGFLANRDFVAQSHVYMRRLVDQSGETANLAVLDGTEAVFIAQVQCREMMRILVKLGSRVPLHASGVGKAIFAALPDEQIDAILKVKGLPRITEHTIVSSETMWAALKVSATAATRSTTRSMRRAPAASRRRSTTNTRSRWGPSRSPARRRGCPTRGSGNSVRSSRTPPKSLPASSAGAGRIRTEQASLPFKSISPGALTWCERDAHRCGGMWQPAHRLTLRGQRRSVARHPLDLYASEPRCFGERCS